MNELKQKIVSLLSMEAAAIDSFAVLGVEEVCAAARLISARSGGLVVSGIGKSGHIARKIASTFRSLGRRAAFMHAAEGSHGDLGLVEDDGVVLVLSNSGETSELADLIAYCSVHDIPVIAVTGSKESSLGRAAELCIAYGKVDEACINGLAPTTSTTLSLAIGDALAVGVSYLNGATVEDFRRYHPGGKLGARLQRVRDVMRKGPELPFVAPHASIGEITLQIAEKSVGCVLVSDGSRTLGIITDGDIRRNLGRISNLTASDLMTRDPFELDSEIDLAQAALRLSEARVSVGVVRNGSDEAVGLLHIHQCVAL